MPPDDPGSDAQSAFSVIWPIAFIRNEFHQGSVRVSEIDAHAFALNTASHHRSDFDRDRVRLKVSDGFFDRALPLEAQVAAARRHWNARVRFAVLARAVDIQLFVAEAIGPTIGKSHKLGAQDVAIKLIGTFPIGDGDNAMIKFWFHLLWHPIWNSEVY